MRADSMKFGDLKRQDSLVRVRREDKAVACIEMMDEEGRNGFSIELVGALLAALKETHEDKDCAAVILKGADGYFSSGATKQLLSDLKASRVAPSELSLCEKLLRHSSVIIAAAEGHAVGGGFAMLLASDMAVIAEDGRYGLNFMRHGFTPGMGVTRLAEDFLGRPFAHRLLYTGDVLRGREFHGSSLEIVKKADVVNRAYELAFAVAENPPQNVALLKRSLTHQRLRALEEATLLESMMHETSLQNMNLEGWEE